MRAMVVLGGTLLALAAAGMPPAADACGMKGGFEERENPILLVDRATFALEEGRAAEALATLRGWTPDPGQEALVARVRRLTARATTLATPATASEAIRDLEALSREHPDDPQILTDLGSALSRVPGERGRALGLLESLAARDLVTGPHGWAALAALRAEPRDREDARARCRLMTTHDREVCGEGPELVPPA